MPTRRILCATVLSLLCTTIVAGPTVAQEDCTIYGEIIAEPNTLEPELGAWVYRLHVWWDTDSRYALSHFDLLVDAVDGNCDCADFAEAITFGSFVGSSTGEPNPCTLSYYHELNCEGDPSIGVLDKLYKFEPFEDEDCEPGNFGTGTFTFYSDLAPVPINEDNLALVDKFAGFYCFGTVIGDFPGMACDPVSDDVETWGSVKELYR